MLARMTPRTLICPLSLLLSTAACGTDSDMTTQSGTSGASATSGGGGESGESGESGAATQVTQTGGVSQGVTDDTGEPGPTTGAGSTTDPTSDTTAADTTGAGTTGVGDTSTGEPDDTTGGAVDVYDPDQDGPWQIAEVKGTWKVDGVNVPMDAFYPTAGPEAGPYPVVVIAHGFQLPASQYTKYAQRLATHGYVALTADFQAGLFNPDHVAYAKQVLGGIDWAAQEPKLAGVADTNNVGLTGHSLGGKLSVLGAVMDGRVRASITLDPVDSATMCDKVKCPDVSDMLPIDVPLGFVGETLDSMGGFMPCAPAADNFLTYYKKATAPALAVTVKGANHMSFIDDVARCGFTCNLCQMPTLDNAVVNALGRAYVVAFYGRWLKDEAGYETYLTGAAAQDRYVESGLADIATK